MCAGGGGSGPRKPRIRVSALRELGLLARLFLRYGGRASRIYYLAITRSLGRKLCTR